MHKIMKNVVLTYRGSDTVITFRSAAPEHRSVLGMGNTRTVLIPRTARELLQRKRSTRGAKCKASAGLQNAL
jgi:hypothetical protein